MPHQSIVGGDRLEPCIAAASIVAKVTRDRVMQERASAYPDYGFDEHKGYGTVSHIDAIRKHGPCALHRPYFLKKILFEQSALLLA